jgi:hypothetical protein
MSAGIAGASGFYQKLSAVKVTTKTVPNHVEQKYQNNYTQKIVNTNTTKNAKSVKSSFVAKGTRDAIAEKPNTASAPAENQKKVVIPKGYKWNLPPHDWSLPLRPTSVDSEMVYNSGNNDFHGLRRGRIWFFEYGGAAQNLNSDGTLEDAYKGVSIDKNQSGAQDIKFDYEWGFQFLWNPESISSQVTRNMNITPSSADTLRVVSGAFPSQETFTVSIVLDRVNDFACARGTNLLTTKNSAGLVESIITTAGLSGYQKYYSSGSYPLANVTTPTFTEKLTSLLAQGTMADLEYLFKTINGSAEDASKSFTSLLGKKTSNIGYLQPSLLAFQFGPSLDNLSWVGWIESLSINHIMFTENMIPLRTEVSISVAAFTGTGVSSI